MSTVLTINSVPATLTIDSTAGVGADFAIPDGISIISAQWHRVGTISGFSGSTSYTEEMVTGGTHTAQSPAISGNGAVDDTWNATAAQVTDISAVIGATLHTTARIHSPHTSSGSDAVSSLQLLLTVSSAAEEDFWSNPVAPVPASQYIQLPAGDQDKSEPPVLFGEPDEDFDVNAVLLPHPVAAKVYLPLPLLPDPDQTPTLSSQPFDEEFDVDLFLLPKPVAKSVLLSLPILSDDAAMPSYPTIHPEEEYWNNPVRPVPPAFYIRLPILDLEQVDGGLSGGGTATTIIGFVSVQQANLWCAIRVVANGQFDLNLLSSSNPDTPVNYVMKQVQAQAITPDAGPANYVFEAEMDIPWPAVGSIQIFSVATIAYQADYRFYMKPRFRRRG